MHMKHAQVQELETLTRAIRTLSDDVFITAPADTRLTLLALAQRIEELPVYVDDDDLAPPSRPCHFAPFQEDPATIYRSEF